MPLEKYFLDDVLVLSACCNRVPPRDWVDWKQQNLFLTLLGVGILRLGGSAWLGSGENPLPDCRWPSSPCVLAGWKESKLTLWSLLVPFKKPLPSGSNDLPEAYLLIPSNSYSTYESGGGQISPFQKRLTFTSIDWVKRTASHMSKGFIQSVEGLKGLWSPRKKEFCF